LWISVAGDAALADRIRLHSPDGPVVGQTNRISPTPPVD
jgi:hypothetical protein